MTAAKPHSRGRGVLKAAVHAPQQVRDFLRDYKTLNSREAKAAFADHWLGLWGHEFDQAWPAVYELLRLVEEDELYKDPRRVGPAAPGGPASHGEMASYSDFRSYFEDRVGRRFETWAELESTYHYAQTYAPELLDKAFPAAQRERAIALASQNRGKPINSGRGPVSAEERAANRDIITISETGKGTNAKYLSLRIERDHPEIAERMRAGEFASVRAAALEAGIAPRTLSVRIDDPESAARSLRKHMSPEDLAVLAELLANGADGTEAQNKP